MTVNAAALGLLQQYRMRDLARFAGISRSEAHSLGRDGLLGDANLLANLRANMSNSEFAAALRASGAGNSLNMVA